MIINSEWKNPVIRPGYGSRLRRDELSRQTNWKNKANFTAEHAGCAEEKEIFFSRRSPRSWRWIKKRIKKCTKSYNSLQKPPKSIKRFCTSASICIKYYKKQRSSAVYFAKQTQSTPFGWVGVHSSSFVVSFSKRSQFTRRRWGSCRRGRGCRTRWTSWWRMWPLTRPVISIGAACSGWRCKSGRPWAWVARRCRWRR